MERTGKELIIASKEFASEQRWRSWFHLWSTLVILVGLIGLAASALPLYICIPASILAGLVVVRMFIVYHDFMHGAILKNSKLATFINHTFGILILSPPAIWKHSHDDHHKKNCNDFGAELGSFPIMTTESYAKASFWKRLGYRIVRNPLIIVCGYITSFFWGKTLSHFLENPRKHMDAGLSMVVHIGLCVLVGMYSVQAMFLAIIIPMTIGAGMGTYLFYAQHNFPGMKRKQGHEWDYVYAALRSSSYMKMSKLMHWFTGNIGYHHVHHLNAKIPFYRLPEAMAAIEELQTPIATSLHPLDVYSCLRLKLWDRETETLMSFGEARRNAAEKATLKHDALEPTIVTRKTTLHSKDRLHRPSTTPTTLA